MVLKNKKKPKNAKEQAELMIGGQAVIEGVMMRTKDRYAVAVRKGKKILLKKEKFISLIEKHRILKLPFIRGIIMLFETMVLGVRTLNYSANQEEGDDKREIGAKEIAITLGLSIVFALLLFKFLPLLLATLTKQIFGANNLLFNLVDGITKLIILVAYLLLIALMPEVRRLFQYHGAEHKVVSCYEKGKELTVNNVRKESTAHPRCGTSFIVLVIILSVIFYLFIPITVGFWAKLGLRILLLPVVAGISYEIIKLSGKHPDSTITKVLIAPSMMVQKLTTREPDGRQIEVAIKSLKGIL